MEPRRFPSITRRVAQVLAVVCLPTTALPGCGTGGWDPAAVAREAEERLSASEGGRRMLEAIGAHGGLEAWYEAPTSAYTWEYSNLAANMRFESYLVADNRSRRVYHELRTYGTPDSVDAVDARFGWTGEDAWISPASRRQPNPRFWALTGYYFESIPFVLADPGIHFRVLEPATLDGVSHDRVMAYFEQGVGDTPGDTYTVYIHPETDMVSAVVYTVTFGQAYEPTPGGPEPPMSGTILFYQEYTTVDGLSVPTRFTGYAFRDGEIGDHRSDAWAREISFSEPFDESLVAVPEDARIEPYSVQ